jgi:NAD(P) transhydrogenase subunit alpha
MKIGVPKEIIPQEKRVALIPESIKRIIKKGFEVQVEAGAGDLSLIPDADYEKAGARIVSSAESLYAESDILLKVQKPARNPANGKDEAELIREGAVLIAFLQPVQNPDLVKKLAARNVTSFSMDAIPRTTLAQSMDALSSMATIAGYKAVLTAANAICKFFPMFMTAAGTIAPAKVLVIGAGVAGLQAIATAKRLGAVVEVFDTRPAAREQAESLGVKAIKMDELGTEETETKGGYARQLSDEIHRKEIELIKKHAVASDVVITTAQIYGKKAPILFPESTVREMKQGSCIVDLAVEQGGNCELTEPGKEVVRHGVIINGFTNVPSSLSFHASQMYSRNIEKFLFHLTNDKGFKFDFKDEITAGSVITHQREVLFGKTP